MLQKLENAYLAILSTVVIVASLVLLIGVVMFGLGALKGFGDGPSDKVSSPDVAADVVIEKMTSPKAMEEESYGEEDPSQAAQQAKDPNQEYYDAAARAIVSFVVRVSGGAENLNEQLVAGVTKDMASSYNTEDLTAAYAKGYSEAVVKILADKKVEDLAKTTSAIEVVNQTLNTFTEEFNAKIQAEHERISAEQEEHIQVKAESASNLYIAGAFFALFLLIVFLSIFIKIERNLRHLRKILWEHNHSLQVEGPDGLRPELKR